MPEENKPVEETKKTDAPDELSTLKSQLEALQKEKATWASSHESLNDKVRKENEEKARKQGDSKALESALTFNLTANEFIKSNETILPKDISDIFKVAATEKYDSAIDRANATKAAIIQSFFSQQSNVELLTESQKISLADYLKLTKNGKEEKARELYDNLLEPALGTLKRVKKAEELSKSNSGFGLSTDADQAYKEKLMKIAEKKFFKGKLNA
jgi:hypothetical protein